MTDTDGTDFCRTCKRVTGSRVERQWERTAFICVVCGCETDACFDDDEWDDEDELADDFCDQCGCWLSACECDLEQ